MRARQKAAARALSIDFVVADARRFQLQQQFPFIYMLENVFQFFLTRQDQEALLARAREHLTPEGCLLFETRHPSLLNRPKLRHAEPQHFTTADGGPLVTTEEQFYDPLTQIQYYTTHRAFTHPDGRREEKTLRTALRYVYPQEMEALLYYNGLQIRAAYGSWQQEPLTATSPAMIYICQRRV